MTFRASERAAAMLCKWSLNWNDTRKMWIICNFKWFEAFKQTFTSEAMWFLSKNSSINRWFRANLAYWSLHFVLNWQGRHAKSRDSDHHADVWKWVKFFRNIEMVPGTCLSAIAFPNRTNCFQFSPDGQNIWNTLLCLLDATYERDDNGTAVAVAIWARYHSLCSLALVRYGGWNPSKNVHIHSSKRIKIPLYDIRRLLHFLIVIVFRKRGWVDNLSNFYGDFGNWTALANATSSPLFILDS